jgi:hypothetical protein
MILSCRFEPSRIIRLVLVLQAMGLLAGVLWTGYAGATYSEVISFRVDDGWCVTPSEGVGEHCFGDFVTPIIDVSDGEVYQGAQPLPPSTLALHSLFGLLGHLTDYGVGLALWLLAGVLGLVLAALAISRRMNDTSSSQVFLVLMLAWPVVSAVDRGTSVLFLVPLVALAIFAEADGRHRTSLILITLAALVRPQFLLCVLALNFRRKIQVVALFITAQIVFAWVLLASQKYFDNWLQIGEPVVRRDLRGLQDFNPVSDILEAVRFSIQWMSGLAKFETSSPLNSDASAIFARVFPELSVTWVVLAVGLLIGFVRAIRGPVAGLSALSLCALTVCASQASSTSPGYYYAIILTAVLSYVAVRETIGVLDLIVLISVSVPVITRVGPDEWRLLNSPALSAVLLPVLAFLPWFVAKWDGSCDTIARGSTGTVKK